MGNALTFRDSLIDWFSENRRDFPWRKETDSYRILIAEKMLQQTSYGHVLKVYDKFIETYPTIHALNESSIDKITNNIRPLGFHNQRAKQLTEMASVIVAEYNGSVPSTVNELQSLPGIGPYVANAVACFAFNQKTPIIDVNVRRVFSRAFKWGNIKDRLLEPILHELLPEGREKEFNWGIIDFSSLICSRKPKCRKCFARPYCLYYSSIHDQESNGKR